MKSSDFHVSLRKSQLGWPGTAKDAGLMTEDVIIRVVTLSWTAGSASARRTSSAWNLPRRRGSGFRKARIRSSCLLRTLTHPVVVRLLLSPQPDSTRWITTAVLFFSFVLKTKTNAQFSPLTFGVLLNAGNILNEWTMGQLYLVIRPVPFVRWSASFCRSLLKMDRTVRN